MGHHVGRCLWWKQRSSSLPWALKETHRLKNCVACFQCAKISSLSSCGFRTWFWNKEPQSRSRREWLCKDQCSVIHLGVVVVHTHTQLNLLGCGSFSLKAASLLLGRHVCKIRSIMTDGKIPQKASQKWVSGIDHFLFLPPLFAFLLFSPQLCAAVQSCAVCF